MTFSDLDFQTIFRSHLESWYREADLDLEANRAQIEFYVTGPQLRFQQMFGREANTDMSPNSVLDIGCGFGHIALYTAMLWPTTIVRARDLDSRYFEVGLRTAEALGISNIEFKEQTAQQLGPQDEAELVVACNMLNYFPDRSERMKVIANLATVTKAGGSLGLYFPHFWTLKEAFTGFPGLQLMPRRIQTLVAKKTGKRSSLMDVHSPAIGEVVRTLNREGLVLRQKSSRWPVSIRQSHVGMYFTKPQAESK